MSKEVVKIIKDGDFLYFRKIDDNNLEYFCWIKNIESAYFDNSIGYNKAYIGFENGEGIHLQLTRDQLEEVIKIYREYIGK